MTKKEYQKKVLAELIAANNLETRQIYGKTRLVAHHRLDESMIIAELTLKSVSRKLTEAEIAHDLVIPVSQFPWIVLK